MVLIGPDHDQRFSALSDLGGNPEQMDEPVQTRGRPTAGENRRILRSGIAVTADQRPCRLAHARHVASAKGRFRMTVCVMGKDVLLHEGLNLPHCPARGDIVCIDQFPWPERSFDFQPFADHAFCKPFQTIRSQQALIKGLEKGFWRFDRHGVTPADVTPS